MSMDSSLNAHRSQIGLIILVVVSIAVDADVDALQLLIDKAEVCWGTPFSAAAFVVKESCLKMNFISMQFLNGFNKLN